MEWKNYLQKFKSYQWHTITKDYYASPDNEALLLLLKVIEVIWWQEPPSIVSIENTVPSNVPLEDYNFLRALSYLANGDFSSFSNIFRQFSPEDWRYRWLNIELLGRSRKFKKQARYVAKLLKSSKDISYIYVALIQSLETTKTNTSHLLDLIRKFPDDKLKPALTLRVNKHVYDSFSARQVEENPPLVYRMSHQVGIPVDDRNNHFNILIKSGFIDKDLIRSKAGIELSRAEDFAEVEHLFYEISNTHHDLMVKWADLKVLKIIFCWIFQRRKEAHKIFAELKNIGESLIEEKGLKIYHRYILMLFIYSQKNTDLYNIPYEHKIIVIGESHSLSANGVTVLYQEKKLRLEPRLVMGVKMHHLGTASENLWKQLVVDVVTSTPIETALMFTIGEIDTRVEEGIYDHSIKNELSVKDVALATVSKYFTFLENLLRGRKNIFVQGTPFPKYERKGLTEEKKELHIDMVRYVNQLMEYNTKRNDWVFLDVYKLSAENDVHLDSHHLKPEVYPLLLESAKD